MALLSDTAAAVEQGALILQRKVLSDSTAALRFSKSTFWVFVHLRSIALRKDGRCSVWSLVGDRPGHNDTDQVDQALSLQYKLEPNLRTYNELLISGDPGDRYRRVSFGFGNTANDADVYFTDNEIDATTDRLKFPQLSDKAGTNIDAEKRRFLAAARLSLGLNDKVRIQFKLSIPQLNNPLRALPEEVQYALQILMLWSNTLKWKYIETHHSRTRFDALSGLVITTCSRTRLLTLDEINKIWKIFKDYESELDLLVAKKTELIPRNLGYTAPLSTSLNDRLTIRTPRKERLWEGRDVFYVIEHIRKNLFAATYEGVPESYGFIFGHPGFIARPKDLESSPLIHIERIRQCREMCEGALDTLNVVDVLGQPRGEPSKLSIVPIAFPLWAKRWDDTEQAFGSSLEMLSYVHREMVVVGLMCRNVMMVYKGGELVCVFNGAWQEIRPWNSIAKKLGIPLELANQIRAEEIYRVLTRIAFGPLPRSIIVGFAENQRAYERFGSEIQPFSDSFGNWPIVDTDSSIESFLMRATKTDGAILTYTDKNNRMFLLSRARVISKIINTNKSSVASGTGDATAHAMARKGSGIISIKVSRDGGMKIRWNGKGPEKVAIPMEYL